MWSWPVMFGGGITMVYGFFFGSGSAWKYFPFIQNS